MWHMILRGLLGLLFLGLAVSPGSAQSKLKGRTGGGAFFRIVVPTDWNGDLILFNHGLKLTVGPNPSLGPLSEIQLAEGFAVAASSFQQIGWALFKTKNDLQHLYSKFVSRFGTPNRVWVIGESLGGIVAAQVIEEASIGNVVAAYNYCGAVGGSRNWDIAIDLRLVYDAVCGEVPGAFIPGGAEGLPARSSLTDMDIAFAVNACTGVLTPPGLRTPEQTERLARILAETNIPVNFLVNDMVFATVVMSDLVHDRGKLGNIGTRNDTVTYDDPVIDATIERISPNPGAENRLERHYTPSGKIGKVKIVDIHTDKDGLVVVENESEYASTVPARNLTTAIVVEDVPTHCGFSDPEVVAGWESLRAWVGGAPQPTATSIQGMCQALSPVFPGPCRFDPNFIVPDMDTRVPPR
ncbi:MAG TPA: hypothetical protein VLK65_09310 [Vicinamibacteria bacterium]|nr:hypothetical protein [Vicinamibacteria bacterium]